MVQIKSQPGDPSGVDGFGLTEFQQEMVVSITTGAPRQRLRELYM